MQNHRLLAAALALDSFSAGELASTSGVPLNTARSEISRKPELFAPVADAPRGGAPGRPPRRYRLRDPDAARTALTSARLDASLPVSLPVIEDEPLSASDDRLLTLELAEHALRRALLSDDPEDREDLASTAMATADRVLDSLDSDPDAERERRARAVRDFAPFLRPVWNPREPRELSFAAAGALAVFACIPGLGAALLLSALVGFARMANALPPIAIVTHPGTQPGDVLRGLRASGWRRRPLAGECVWSPEWAEPLMERHFLAGVVIGDSRGDAQELTSLIDTVQAWRLPTVVACPPDSAELQTRVFAQGATPMPTPDAEAAVLWFRQRLTDHTQALAPALAAPARVPALAQP